MDTKREVITSIKGRKEQREGGPGKEDKNTTKREKGKDLGSSDEIRGPKSYNPYQWIA